MARRRLGLWIVGARGGVATTVAVGQAALAQQQAPPIGLLTDSPMLEAVDFCPWGDLVLGGHEIRSGSLEEACLELEKQNGALPAGSSRQYRDQLAAFDQRIRPGVLYRSGAAIEALAEDNQATAHSSPREAIRAISEDLSDFRLANELDRVVVVLLGSTEPILAEEALPTGWDELSAVIEANEAVPLRASSLYTIAAIQSGMPVINFTPSLGGDCAAIEELAIREGVALCGRDGKTGETLLKSVLAPMFAARRLQVDSWVSHNLLGNRDGDILADPENKAAKVQSKEAALESTLGYTPHSHVSIEPTPGMGDWKTAWDHVVFRGFMGVPMTLQFTWQGCDSALAAPLVLDLARLVDLAARSGESGAIAPLAFYFKSPMGGAPHALDQQLRDLVAWAHGTQD